MFWTMSVCLFALAKGLQKGNEHNIIIIIINNSIIINLISFFVSTIQNVYNCASAQFWRAYRYFTVTSTGIN